MKYYADEADNFNNPRQSQEPVWTVSQVNQAVKECLETGFMPFWMVGEVSGLLLHRSGHVYFSLKDSTSQIKVCFFRGVELCRKLGLRDGMLVEVKGRLSAYVPRGEYNFTVQELRMAGEGDLQRRFAELKAKLEREGLFAAERKKPLPLFPRCIGVITSPTGAALQDFLRTISSRLSCVKVKIYPAQVQGEAAVAELIRGLEFFNRTNCVDVIVLTRGGGSIEDLWCFNNELLARCVADSRIPVISAIGHEIDFTICDYVADHRSVTPTAAGNEVIEAAVDLMNRFELAVKHLAMAPKLHLAELRRRLEKAASSYILQRPAAILEEKARIVDDMEGRLLQAVKNWHQLRESKVEQLAVALRALDPQRQLERGYAMVLDADNGNLVTSQKEVGLRTLDIRFADGKVRVKPL